jgi:hypothetical protein
MKLKTILIIAAATAFLAGCQTAEELAQEDDAICRGYGVEFGSPEYAQCRQAQQADRTQRYQAYQQRMAAESAARTLADSINKQKERDREARKRCSFTAPDKDGWSKRVCTYD